MLIGNPINVVHGPSPRGWGKQCHPNHAAMCWRTIPTRVGKTGSQRKNPAWVPDHPHAGGENSAGSMSSSSDAGPSPRGWGKRRRQPEALLDQRTIPTRVGKTINRSKNETTKTDHPHAGGENSRSSLGVDSASGPSPRGWGKPSSRPPRASPWRTIPTRVGKTPAI